MSWTERRSHIDALLAEEALQRVLGRDVLDAGILLDSAEHLLAQAGLDDANRARLTAVIACALHPRDDFRHYCTLQSTPHSTVDIVQYEAGSTGGSVYVRKSISKDFAARMTGVSPWNERDLLVAALEERPSPYVPRLLATLQDASSLYFVLDYLPAGTLLDVLETRPGSQVPEPAAKHWTAEAIRAIRWTHDCGFAHRDIKPNNFLLTASGHLKLTDFGSSAPFDRPQSQGPYLLDPSSCMTPVGTVDYIAPEILLAHQAALDADASDVSQVEDSETYGPEVDWWSLGVTVYEMLYGTTPFFASSIPETYELIIRSTEFLHFPETASVSSAVVEVLIALISPAETRLGRFFGADELERHAYFVDLDFEHLLDDQGPLLHPPRPPPSPSLQQTTGGLSPVSSLFTSPGLSILRPASDEESPDAWIGFTYLPLGDAFDEPTPELPNPARGPVTSHAFTTPARASSRSATQSASRSRNQRALGDDLEALREVAEYGALKTVERRRSSSRPLPTTEATVEPLSFRPSTPARPPPAGPTTPTLSHEAAPSAGSVASAATRQHDVTEPTVTLTQVEDLETRHRRLVGRIDHLANRLERLSDRAKAENHPT